MNIEVVLIVTAVFAAGSVGSYFIGRRLRGASLALLWIVFGLVSAALFGLAATTPGWDALIYAVVLFVGCAPAGVGMIVGSILGRYHRGLAGAGPALGG